MRLSFCACNKLLLDRLAIGAARGADRLREKLRQVVGVNEPGGRGEAVARRLPQARGRGIQQLVQPVAAGVLFTRNPMTGADERVIEAYFGGGKYEGAA